MNITVTTNFFEIVASIEPAPLAVTPADGAHAGASSTVPAFQVPIAAVAPSHDPSDPLIRALWSSYDDPVSFLSADERGGLGTRSVTFTKAPPSPMKTMRTINILRTYASTSSRTAPLLLQQQRQQQLLRRLQ